MKNLMRYKGYTGTVEYSEEDGCLFGRLSGIDDIISYEGESVSEIRRAFQEAVDDYLADCAATGKQPEKPYSGRFVLRLDPELHARLAMRAREAGKSLNQYAVDVLAHA
ncbi:type II toxin-antitoxin system HicB family antitoxin [uncultured Desulfovibrio sp.]|uniref:type II toxin-antitoxin system HicB family antitoxin n=1 Tax=uncultured Desulfovibrio sp. TaxID=167968 RepID=UPI00262C3A78|nr:type II toxin-antitoxin system HicB family antitoxin [uncultured Desulfovibrio sp.]